MGFVEAAVYGVHLLFAGLWSGSVLFVTLAILPVAMDGDIDPAPMELVTSRLKQVSRASALLLLLTGGHLAATFYTGSSLLNTTRGNLVLVMVVLWFLLAAFTEIAASRLSDGLAQQKIREPARNARPFLLAASLVSVLLLFDAGALLGL
jgi:uncharacterized membrane protein